MTVTSARPPGPALIDRFIIEFAEHRALMALHQRNQSAVEDLHRSERHRLDNDDMERKFRRLLSSPDIPVAMRVRMACSIGAVMGGMPCTSMLDDVPADDLTNLVREAVRGMFESS